MSSEKDDLEKIVEKKITERKQQIKKEAKKEAKKQAREEVRKELEKEIAENVRKEAGNYNISRRKFLKKVGLGAAGLGAVGLMPAASQLKLTKNGIFGSNSQNQEMKDVETLNAQSIDTNGLKVDGEGSDLHWNLEGTLDGQDGSISLSKNLEPHIDFIKIYYGGNFDDPLKLTINGDTASGNGNYRWVDNADNEYTGKDSIQLTDGTGNGRGGGIIHIISSTSTQLNHRPLSRTEDTGAGAILGGWEPTDEVNSIDFSNVGNARFIVYRRDFTNIFS